MSQDSSSIVSKVWSYAHVLKNAGVGYGDYVEQITYLLFLKLTPPSSRSTGLGQAGLEMPELGLDHS
jgi:type I restriction enzyme M protein